MNIKNEIEIGISVPTMCGELRIVGKSQNSDCAFCDEYEADNNGNLILTGCRFLTLNEIAKEMKGFDGFNHIVKWRDD